jgi:hypothetical protein
MSLMFAQSDDALSSRRNNMMPVYTPVDRNTNVTRTWGVDEAEAHGEHRAHETVGEPRLLEIHSTAPLRHTTQSRVCGVDYVQARPCERDDLTMDGLVSH